MTFYVSEVQGFACRRESRTIQAKNLRAAKMIATRDRCFCDTTLIIGTKIDENGFLDPGGIVATNGGGFGWVS